MKIVFLSLLCSIPFLLGATTAHAGESCSIEANWQYCGPDGEVFDAGCTVTCDAHQTASCQPASAFDIPGPYGMHGSCQLFPSYCACEN